MLRTRLYLGLLPLVLLIVAVGVYAIQVTRELSGTVQHDLVRSYRSLVSSQQLRYAAREMVNAVAAAGHDPLGARRGFAEAKGNFTRELMEQSALAGGTPGGALVEQLDGAFTEFAGQAEVVLTGGGAVSLTDFKSNEAAFYRVISVIEAMNRRDLTTAEEAGRNAETLVATTQRVLVITIVGAFLLALLLAWRLAASLLGPIKSLTASAVAVGEGDLDRTVPELSSDELGRLGAAFNQMATKLRAYREATVARVMRTQRTMEATLTSAPDPVFVVERDGAHAVRNPAAEALVAANPELATAFPPELDEPLRRVWATGEHYLPTDYGHVITLRVAREDRHFLPRILAIGDQLTDFKGAALVLQDVTKLRLLDDAKTNLVGTVSHELKTPLTGLRMAIYLLLEQNIACLTPTQRELLETARDDADRLLRILDNLLDMARFEAGAASLECSVVTVGRLVAENAAEGRGLFPTAETLRVIVDPGLEAVALRVDVARLRHVFVNLLTNAAKYAPGSPVTLSAVAASEGLVRFAVRDEGPGIAAEHVPHVFERFYRVPGQLRLKSGAGLGLAIAREIVVAHGGSMACESEPGRGTEFSFRLPREA